MQRNDAIRRLKQLIGKDLRQLADSYGITVWKCGKKNKGWAGHVIERYLGLPLNVAQAPNFGSWELKIVPLKVGRDGKLRVKETMAITMIDPYNVVTTPFERSHLLAKLQKAVICARVFESPDESRSLLFKVATFDLSDPQIYSRVRHDYELVRRIIKEKGFDALTGKMGILVQPRTKGKGHGSTTRAFYARKHFVAAMLGLPSYQASVTL